MCKVPICLRTNEIRSLRSHSYCILISLKSGVFLACWRFTKRKGWFLCTVTRFNQFMEGDWIYGSCYSRTIKKTIKPSTKEWPSLSREISLCTNRFQRCGWRNKAHSRQISNYIPPNTIDYFSSVLVNLPYLRVIEDGTLADIPNLRTV